MIFPSRSRHLYDEQFIPRPLDEVFAFFSKPENLQKITPPQLGFVIRTPSPIAMRAGQLIEYTIRLGFFRVRWISRISQYEPPHLFVDEQVKGPYSFWHHTHRFKTVEGGTQVIDEVCYQMPLGPLGHLAHGLWVKKQLAGIFEFRRKAIQDYFLS